MSISKNATLQEIDKSEDYLRMTYLVEDDIFKYLGDYKYEMIE